MRRRTFSNPGVLEEHAFEPVLQEEMAGWNRMRAMTRKKG
jgi:hypothetical protein